MMTIALIRRFALVAVCAIALLPCGVTRSMAGGAPHRIAATSAPSPRWQVLFSASAAPHLSHPEGIAIDQGGRSVQKWMYVADSGKNRIVKLGTGGRYLGQWGTAGSGPGQFQNPTAVAVDPQDNVYVADTGNNRIQKFGPQGQFLGQWGTKGTDPGQFDDPTGVAVGGSGNVFVADRVNSRIEKFSPSGRLLAVWPVNAVPGSAPTGFGPAGPYALTLHAAGNVYAAVDTGQCSGGHCVMDYVVLETRSSSGTVLRRVVGGNPYGDYPQPHPGTKGGGPWWQIGALTADQRGHLFLAGWTPQNRTSVTEVSSKTAFMRQWVLPPPSDRGWPPQGIALDPRGNVYLTDTLSNRVLRLVFRP